MAFHLVSWITPPHISGDQLGAIVHSASHVVIVRTIQPFPIGFNGALLFCELAFHKLFEVRLHHLNLAGLDTRRTPSGFCTKNYQGAFRSASVLAASTSVGRDLCLWPNSCPYPSLALFAHSANEVRLDEFGKAVQGLNTDGAGGCGRFRPGNLRKAINRSYERHHRPACARGAYTAEGG